MTEPSTPARPRRRSWVAFTTVVACVIFVQAVTAGRIFAGDGWARSAHRATAALLVVSVFLAGIVAIVSLRSRVHGRPFGLSLLALAVSLFVQEGLGSAAAEGRDTLWLHIPVGVAIFALALRTIALARRVQPREVH